LGKIGSAGALKELVAALSELPQSPPQPESVFAEEEDVWEAREKISYVIKHLAERNISLVPTEILRQLGSLPDQENYTYSKRPFPLFAYLLI
jgi:hypothetical protein